MSSEYVSLKREQRATIAALYAAGRGTIHGYAAHCGVPIREIKCLLDEHGVEHGKNTARGRSYIGPLELEQALSSAVHALEGRHLNFAASHMLGRQKVEVN